MRTKVVPFCIYCGFEGYPVRARRSRYQKKTCRICSVCGGRVDLAR